MDLYIAINNEERGYGHLWELDGGIAKRADTGTDPFAHEGSHAVAENGETALQAMERKFPMHYGHAGKYTLHKLNLNPGEYYPRMARPSTPHVHESPGLNPGNKALNIEMASLRGQLIALAESLETICRTIHPDGDNLKAYGHEVRNLILLACTEVETHWKAVLRENNASGESTKDYIKLLGPMKLDQYSIAFPRYPWLSAIQPFQNWAASQPTRSLTWYHAYNGVKHDREQHFSEAKLQYAFEAVAACVVMMLAQFGWPWAFDHDRRLSGFFALHAKPVWHPSDAYVRALPGFHETPISYPF